MKQRALLFIVSFILWMLLVWPFGGPAPAQDIVAGLAVALVVSLVIKEMTTHRFRRWLNPARFFWFFVYLFVLAWNVLKANFDVAYRILHPLMPIHPGIVRVRTSLKTETAIAFLAHSIGLTPGTLVADATRDGFLYVHWLNVRSVETEEATRLIVKRYEWVVARIFE